MKQLVKCLVGDSTVPRCCHHIWVALVTNDGVGLTDFPATKKNKAKVSK
jgi:hypothetical protein